MGSRFDFEDLDHIRAVDASDMLSHIYALPQQFANAWQHAQTLPLPDSHRQPRQIVLCGMGGSAIGGSLAAALVSATAPVSFSVVRGYDLPAYVSGPDTLVIASSFSGNTEETLSAANTALERQTRLLAITTGGQLSRHANAHGYPLWQFDYRSQPRAALGWSLGLLLGLAHRLNLAPTLEADLDEAVRVLNEYQDVHATPSPQAHNPAKQGAAKLLGRIPSFYGGGIFEPVARRWKGQINENAKAWAQYEGMPEANHNAVTGIIFPEDRISNMIAVFISSPAFDHPRVALRYQLTAQIYQQHGIEVEMFRPQGISALAQMCHAIQYGDFLSFYTAIAYGADPTEIAPIMELKAQLSQHI